MLRVLMEKVDNMQEEMSNVSRDMETSRKKQKDRLESKNPATNEKCSWWTHQ